MRAVWPVAAMLPLLAACNVEIRLNDDGDETADFDFSAGLDGWEIGFADYPAGTSAAEQRAIDEFHELTGTHARLPAPLDATDGAARLTGNNHSDDLFMFLKRQVSGLRPLARYRVELRVVLASNAPRGCAGVGGSPGESVYIKGGASTVEPRRLLDPATQQWILNIDKGNQASGGADAVVLGDFANSKDCDDGDFSYELKTLRNAEAIEVAADADGRAWLLIGSDSAFEGTTTIFYTRIEAVFLPA